MIFTLCLTIIHFTLQYIEDAFLPGYFKHRGDIPNRITCSVSSVYLISGAIHNLMEGGWGDLSLRTRYIEHRMLEFFVYDLCYMFSSGSHAYYAGYIVHHVASVYIIVLANLYDVGTNLLDNTLIVLLEFPTLFLNADKIIGGCTLLKRYVYLACRVILYGMWMVVTPFTVRYFTWASYVVYTGFIVIYIASYKWYKQLR